VIHLKQITLRGIPAEVERMIKREAEKKGLSLNKAFVSLYESPLVQRKRCGKGSLCTMT
jgi:hypothetical protein